MATVVRRAVPKKQVEAKSLNVDLDSLNQVLSFVEQYLTFNSIVRPTFDQEFEEAGALIPSRVLAEIKVATKALLTEPKSPQGKLVVVTGPSKSGKETQISNPAGLEGVTPLTRWFLDHSYNVMTTAFSYDNVIGGLVGMSIGRTRDNIVAEGAFDVQLTWVLRSLERAMRNARLREWLAKDKRNLVIAKGWTESDVAYQSVRGVATARILELERNLSRPQLIFVLEASSETILQRGGSQPPACGNADELSLIAQAFHRLPELYPFGELHSIDANKSSKEVNVDLIDLVNSLFG